MAWRENPSTRSAYSGLFPCGRIAGVASGRQDRHGPLEQRRDVARKHRYRALVVEPADHEFANAESGVAEQRLRDPRRRAADGDRAGMSRVTGLSGGEQDRKREADLA